MDVLKIPTLRAFYRELYGIIITSFLMILFPFFLATFDSCFDISSDDAGDLGGQKGGQTDVDTINNPAGLGERLGEKLGENQKRILRHLSSNSLLTIKDIGDALGISTTAVENNIAKLKQKNC